MHSCKLACTHAHFPPVRVKPRYSLIAPRRSIGLFVPTSKLNVREGEILLNQEKNKSLQIRKYQILDSRDRKKRPKTWNRGLHGKASGRAGGRRSRNSFSIGRGRGEIRRGRKYFSLVSYEEPSKICVCVGFCVRLWARVILPVIHTACV